jgi:hypothetical protein
MDRNLDRDPSEVTVIKIGRKWAEIDHGRRISIETMWVDHGQYTSSERCYASIEERQNERALEREWDAFRKAIGNLWHSPTTNIDSIRQAGALLGVAFTPPARGGDQL